METATKTTNKLETQSVRDFFKENGFKTISPVVYGNINGYPYVVFTTPDGARTNVYFSKNAARMVAIGQPVTKQLIETVAVAEVLNANNEERIKLVSAGGIDLDELLG